MKPVFIIAIVAVAMIGVMVPSSFAEEKESGKLFPQHFRMSEVAENVIVSNRGPHIGTVSLQNVEVIDKEHYNLIKTSVKIKVNVDLQEFVKIYYKAIAIVTEKGAYEAEILSECKSPRDYNGLRDDRFFHVSGKMGGEFIIESCFSVEKHYEEFDIYYANFTPQTTGEYLEKTSKAAQIYHMGSYSLNNSNFISTDSFSDLTDNIISESSKMISEYSQDSDVVIEQNFESVQDTTKKKLVCPSNSYFGMDNDGNVVCRDLKTNEIVPSISTNKSILDDSSSQTTTQTSNSQKSPSFFDILLQFFQNLFGGVSSEPIENTINQIPDDIPEKINQVVDDQLQQAEKLIPNVPINPLPTAECLSKEGEKRVTCLMGVNSNVKTKDWTYADYDYVVDFWQKWCGNTAGLYCKLYYDQIQIAYDHLYG